MDQQQAEICGYCTGKPRTLVSSHSGTITVAVSLQEPVVFLAGSQPFSPSSYREHDNREAMASHTDQQAAEEEETTTSNNRHPSEEGGSTPPPPPSSAQQNLAEQPPAILRGSILLKLTKPTKLKSLSLGFFGRCKTVWNQGPNNPYDDSIASHPLTEFQDEVVINSHNWEFLSTDCKPVNNNNNNGNSATTTTTTAAASAVNGGSETIHTVTSNGSAVPQESVTSVCTDLYGADVVKFKNENEVRTKTRSEMRHNSGCKVIPSQNSSEEIPLFMSNPTSSRRKSLFSNASSMFHKESIQFPAGEYVYNFTLAIDPRVPETINAPKGGLNYYLVPKVVRAGAFAMNLSGNHEVELVRQPPNNCDSLSNNPIAISRNWDDRLHYEILIPKKYISLGSSIPMAIKLTPLEKVQVHRVRVHVVESVHYTYSHDPSISYTDRSLKILLYEKRAKGGGGGGSSSSNDNKKASEDDGAAGRPSNEESPRNSRDDAHSGNSNGHGLLHLPLKKNSSNGDGKKKREKLTGNLLHYTSRSDFEQQQQQQQQQQPLSQVASTSSANTNNNNSNNPEDAAATTIDCTLPLLSETGNCSGLNANSVNFFQKATTSETYVKSLHPDTFNCPFIKIRHRLTISFRISKQDPEDTKRRHFEVKIDTPIHFLSKYCINENVELPEYEFIVDQGHGQGAMAAAAGGTILPPTNDDGAPLTFVNSNDSSFGMQTVALTSAGVYDPQLPSFNEALGEESSDSGGDEQVPPPPDYETVVSR